MSKNLLLDRTPFSNEWMVGMLIQEYEKYGKIIVAYDFDNTVHPDTIDAEDTCKLIRVLLRVCSKYTEDIDMICYTCRGESDVNSLVIPYLDKHGIRHDKINENSDSISEETRKTLSCKLIYTIFLDDKTGLRTTYMVLANFIRWLKYIKAETDQIIYSW